MAQQPIPRSQPPIAHSHSYSADSSLTPYSVRGINEPATETTSLISSSARSHRAQSDSDLWAPHEEEHTVSEKFSTQLGYAPLIFRKHRMRSTQREAATQTLPAETPAHEQIDWSPTAEASSSSSYTQSALRHLSYPFSRVLSSLPQRNPQLSPVIQHETRLKAQSQPEFTLLSPNSQATALESAGTTDAKAGRFPPGSVRASIFNLCSATLGAGALSLPYAFSQVGIILGTILILIAALAAVYSIKLLLRSRDATCLSSYEDLSMHCFGTFTTTTVEINIWLFCFGTMVAYIICIGDIFYPIINFYAPTTLVFLQSKPLVMCVFVVIIMLPLSLVDKVSSLRFTSLLGVLSIVYLVCCIAFRCIQHLSHKGLHAYSVVWWDASIQHVFSATPILLFSYTCHVNVFSIYTELARPSIRRMHMVVNRSTAISTCIYLIIGLTGYIWHGRHTQTDILNNLSLTDPLMVSAQLAVGLALILSFPLNVFPARMTMEVMLYSHAPHSKHRFRLITIVLVGLSLLLGLYARLDSVFGLMGSISSTLVCFVLPPLFFLRSRRKEVQMDANPQGEIGELNRLMSAATVHTSTDPESSTAITTWEYWCAMALLVAGVVVGCVATVVSINNIWSKY